MKKFIEVLAGLKMTIVSGIFLAASLILMLTRKEPPIDPAWVQF